MSGLELPGFIIGLTALATVFDKTCVIWRTVADAQGFGDDVADWMRKLQMEFFRFQTWWTALERLASRRPAVAAQTRGMQFALPKSAVDSTLLGELRKTYEDPITNAASSILKLMSDIEVILRAEGVLAVIKDRPAQNAAGNALRATPPSLSEATELSHSRRKEFAKSLMTSVSWWTRMKHDATPWRESHKSALEAKLRDISYWNKALYDILPGPVKDSVLRQGISGHVLIDIEEAVPIAELRQGSVSEQANLLVVRKKMLETKGRDPELDRIESIVKLDVDSFKGYPKSLPASNFSIVTYQAKSEERESVLVEWYPYPLANGSQDAYETQRLAGNRLTRLSWLLHKSQRPSTLRALDCLGCLESDALKSFGLVSSIPPSYSTSLPPVTLHDLLLRKALTSQFGASAGSAAMPTLAQRFSLAASLASSLYTFMLAQWHHKRFNSLNVMFLFANDATSAPDLSSPLVAGYSVARPNAPTEISVFGSSTPESGVYLHPDLRVAHKDMPKYRLNYEIYAFGLLLLEIGFWNTASKLAAASMVKGTLVSPSTQLASLIKKCKSDLACWMGEQYRDITLRCLEADTEFSGEVGECLTKFYWSVVLDIISCS
ncbi:hypothetical protein LTS12_003304 [Elasticomyces elasticus]|nr:hypothetical protein LTS12_003304 [Elasticomyces elasticus]